MMTEIISAYKKKRTYDDRHLYQDHLGWLKQGFEEGWFEFPDDYDFDTNRWSMGMMLNTDRTIWWYCNGNKKGFITSNRFPIR